MSWSRNYRPLTARQKQAIRRRDGSTCQSCGGGGNQVDHIVPVSQGGTADPENLRVLCDACHGRKSQAEAAYGASRKASLRYQPAEPHPGMLAPASVTREGREQ